MILHVWSPNEILRQNLLEVQIQPEVYNLSTICAT